MSELPETKCPNTDKVDCRVCGRFLWYGPSPSWERWRIERERMQERHNQLRQDEFNKMALEEKR